MKSKDLNRSIPERYVWEEMVYLPIECEGEQIDVLEGYLTSHLVVHYTNGEYLWQNEQFSYKLTSQETKEVFIGKDKFHFDGITWTGAGHTNIRGDKGTHYILHYTWKDWVYTFTKTQCIEKEL
jgi:hypothetical protein